ncbi:MAG TPA: ABC transporter substrate binding protein, partial [Bacillota bacterium]
VTGVRYPGPGIAIKRFELMMELVPNAKSMLIPYQKGAPTVPAQMELLAPAAKKAGVVLTEAPAADARELDEFLQALVRAGKDNFDAILFLAEPLTVLPDAFAVISSFAEKRRIPIGGAIMTHGNYGSVFGVNTDLMASGGQAAFLADKVLKGANPGTLPVLSAEIFIELNYKIIQELGLNISEGLLSQAHKIIR